MSAAQDRGIFAARSGYMHGPIKHQSYTGGLASGSSSPVMMKRWSG